ncbi:hypothetical protein [Thermospira aquatica]|uniref:Uncharacterized protein n=1 Tax=Thermospira aquatica TaxID=2828656 RepID=A0AAX3BA68_9SPIR|nr:hypothetical protein [Thermospira aquatica]URA09071.1 hypothetical protein KDW03_06065 [Thermospira aquatica]
MNRTRYQLEIGLLSAFAPEQKFAALALFYGGFAFQSKFVDFYFSGAPPLISTFSLMQAGLVFNINPFFGIGAEWSHADLFHLEKDTLENSINSFNGDALGLGIKIRPFASTSAKLFMGEVLQGEVFAREQKFPMTAGIHFPPTYVGIHIESFLTENVGMHFLLLWFQPYYGSSPTETDTRVTGIYGGASFTYRFSLANNETSFQ